MGLGLVAGLIKKRDALQIAPAVVRAAAKKVPELEKRAVVLWLRSKGVELEPWQKAQLGIEEES